jgi:hypothetical protein
MYALGWTRGINTGFDLGCIAGLNAKAKHDEESDHRFEAKCSADRPLRGVNPDLFAGLVTQFYRKYPAHRAPYVEYLLGELAQGQTIEEIHNLLVKGG